ncbi:hypothetical protein [Streptomyces botrytidirepellens]|uniref:Uncharacterized protein n=1 Tax=Streptomyces botrytidirepellens TaxID=2486417 RepID=A0A3M8W516_9ACTN|nr:hypothetical protein [Streptomyces botrytidirepellens]RNG24537.1 hypothetical protein EEJ42_17435 [Streptomyces botrytidirepellens]
MIVLALACVLLLVVGGCVCVVWAARGGPRWVRAVSAVTLALGEVARASGRGSRSGSGSTGDDGDS